MKNIKRIYLGLPDNLKQKVFWVQRDYRKNPLSFIPNGADIIVEYQNGQVFGYDWIKDSSDYVRKIIFDHFENGNFSFKQLSQEKKLENIKNTFSKLYVRIYHETEFETEEFTEIWNNEIDILFPWDKAREYDHKRFQEQRDKKLITFVEAKKLGDLPFWKEYIREIKNSFNPIQFKNQENS